MFSTDAICAVMRQAAEVTYRIQNSFVAPAALEKTDKSPVTVGDLAVQTLVAARLSELTPEIPLVAEESAASFESPEGQVILGLVVKYLTPYLPEITPEKAVQWLSRGRNDDSLRDAPCFWTLDPIDGTKGFLRREQYAIALGFLEQGQVTQGFLALPNLTWTEQGLVEEKPVFEENVALPQRPFGSLLMAQRGQGSWISSLFASDGTAVRIHASQQAEPSQMGILRSVVSGHTNIGQIDILAERLGVSVPPMRMDSQAKYGVLAVGRGDVYFRLLSPSRPDYKERIWDHAAGLVILEEAGGRVTDLDGKPLDFTQGSSLKKNRGVCASNGCLHDTAIQAIQALGF